MSTDSFIVFVENDEYNSVDEINNKVDSQFTTFYNK